MYCLSLCLFVSVVSYLNQFALICLDAELKRNNTRKRDAISNSDTGFAR